MFLCMIMNSALLLLVRSVSTALLMYADKRYFFYFYGGDVALSLLYKWAMRDYTYWIPVEQAAMSAFFSTLVRLILKVSTDFAGSLQARNSPDLGGLYWSVNVALAFVVCFVSVGIYEEEVGKSPWAWWLVGGLSTGWGVVFVLFLGLMKKDYLSSFVSTQTGVEYACAFFLEGADDEAKSQVFDCNRIQWRGIREQVREWVEENWWKWRTEKPAWYTEHFVGRIPIDWIPVDCSSRKTSGGGIGRTMTRRAIATAMGQTNSEEMRKSIDRKRKKSRSIQ